MQAKKNGKMPRTTKATQELSKANETAAKAEKSIDNTVSNMRQKVKRAEKEMNRTATSMARTMLLSNYAKSGVKTRTGKLKSALSQAEAKVILGGKNPRLTVTLPSGIGNYDAKHGGGDFYKAAASVNYGSVRNSGEKNTKRRKNIKKKVLKAADKKNPKDVVVEGRVLGAAKKTEAGSIDAGGGTVVTKPHNFWELNASQQIQIRNAVMQIFNQIVFAKE